VAKRRRSKRNLPKHYLLHYTCTQLGCWYTFAVYIKASEVGYLPCPKCGCSAERLGLPETDYDKVKAELEKMILAEQ
jgi:hypothetical protein